MSPSPAPEPGSPSADELERLNGGVRLSDLGGSAEQTPDPHAVLARFTERAGRLLGSERLLVFILDPQSGRFIPLPCSRGFAASTHGALRIPSAHTLMGEATSSEESIYVARDLEQDHRLDVQQLHHLGADSLLAIPIVYEGKDEAGNVVSRIPLGAMLALDPEEEAVPLGKVFGRQAAQLILLADYVPKAYHAVETYRRGISSLGIALAFVDGDGLLFDVNPAMEQFGVGPALRGVHFRDAFVRRGAVFVELLEAALDGGESRSMEVTIPVTDETGRDRLRTFRVQVEPSYGREDGELVRRGATVAVIDITQVEQDQRLTGSVLATISHDLRTPLTVIQGYAQTGEMLLDNRDPNDPVDLDMMLEFFQGIDMQSRRMGRLVGDMLDAERIAQGMELQIVMSDFDLIESVNFLVKSQASFSHNCQLRVESDVASLTVRADRDRVEQVLANYLSNAVKYSPQGGEVVVVVATSSEAVRVEVKDQGIGIPADQMEKLFGRLARIDSERHQGIKGTGLGLFLCKHLIERHGGEVGVASEYGHGSTFSFTLPRAAT